MQANTPQQSRSRDDGLQSVADCLPRTGLLAHGKRLAELNQRLHQGLPATLAKHVLLADIRARRAVFLASSSAWASRLRLLQTQLISLLLTFGEQVDAVVVKVALPQRDPQPPTTHKPLSPTAAAHLRAVAASVADPELKAQFLALASLAE